MCIRDRLVIAWRSVEYIGPSGIQLEVTAAAGSVIRSTYNPSVFATVVRINGEKVIETELHITVSQDFPTASVACHDVDQGTTTPVTFGILGMYNWKEAIHLTTCTSIPLSLNCTYHKP